MALKVILEGTPASFPVQPFNPSVPVYFEAGMVGALDNNGKGTKFVAGTSTVAFGIIADRRSTTVGMSNANYLPSNPGAYGDESLFNQPGQGNSLYGTTGTTNNVIPANTIPTTTLLRDETATNVNADARFVTMYIRGGLYATDQFDAGAYVPGTALFASTTTDGFLSATGTVQVGICTKAVDGNGLLEFKLTTV